MPQSNVTRVFHDAVHHFLEILDPDQQCVYNIPVNNNLLVPDHIKKVFYAVGELVDIGKAEKTGVPLHAVDRPENLIDYLKIRRIGLKLDKGCLNVFQRFVGLINKSL